jgi:PqqD family protein of HPr-rel-A system
MRDGWEWRIPAESQLHWRAWEDDVVLFDARSGETHLLNAVAAEVLKSLAESPADLGTLARRVAIHFDVAPDSGWLSRLKALLARFDEAGLVEPVPR